MHELLNYMYSIGDWGKEPIVRWAYLLELRVYGNQALTEQSVCLLCCKLLSQSCVSMLYFGTSALRVLKATLCRTVQEMLCICESASSGSSNYPINLTLSLPTYPGEVILSTEI
eukprot:4405148-Amphidinium_carterae.1